METAIRLAEAMGFWGWLAVIAVAAIVAECISKWNRMEIKHAERMAKIAAGQDPGDESTAYKEDEV